MRLAIIALVLLTASASAQRREVPDYDGRGDEPTTAGDVLLWVPRILLAPAYLVTEYGLRRPLGAGVRAGEQGRVHQKLMDALTFDGGRAGLFPTFFVDFGLRPSVGVLAFVNDVGVEGNDLKLRAAFGGTDWLAFALTDTLGPVSLRAAFARRPDRSFYGVGPSSTDATRSRWGSDTSDATLTLTLPNVRASAGLRNVAYRAPAGDNPTIVDRVAMGELDAPPGLDEDYLVVRATAAGWVDTRSPTGPGSGVRLEGRLEAATEPDGNKRWLRAGATAGVSWDVTGTRRILGLAVNAEMVTAFSGGVVPFPELETGGGQGILRGFREGRLLGASSLAATLTYQWPVWAFLDGTAHVAVGNVWGEHWRDFDPDLLRLSAGLGVRTNGSPDQAFEVLFAFGTETFAEGGEIESFRLLMGTHHGF